VVAPTPEPPATRILEVGRRSGKSSAAGEDRTKGVEVSNEDLELNVSEELVWDPKVDNAAIAVSADEGVVTLRGTVGSFRQKREAKQHAERVYGVEMVNNELQVRILDAQRRDDADLRGAVLQALMLDSLVPSTIDARVDEGWVTLTGRPTGGSSGTKPGSSLGTSLVLWASTPRSSWWRRARVRATSSIRSRRRWSATRSSMGTVSQSRARTGKSRSTEL